MAHSAELVIDATETIDTTSPLDVDIVSFNQECPRIRQIGSAIDDIQNYVLKDTFNIYPERAPKDDIRKHLETLLNDQFKAGLAYVSDNISVSANINTKPLQPNAALFDVFLIVQGFPATVFTVVKDEEIDIQDVKSYNLSLARGLNDSIRQFTNELFSVVYGLMTVSDLKNSDGFQQALLRIKKESSRLCVPKSLSMLEGKFLNLIRSFLSVVAKTLFVFKNESGITLWFLTREQFCILTENIDQREVTVRTPPTSGGKVLMREVAKRLERSGPTVLVMESEKQIQEERCMKTCSFIKTKEEWRNMLENGEQLDGLTNMVTNCDDCPRTSEITGRSWTFSSVPRINASCSDDQAISRDEKDITLDDTSELRQRTDELYRTNRMEKTEHENEGKNKQDEIARIKRDNTELKMQIDQLKRTREEEKQQHDVELKEKDREVKRLQDEVVISKQQEEELSRLLESVSLGGVSLDSGFHSDTRSLASWTSRSTAASTLSLDTQGAKDARGRSKGLFKKLIKKLQGSKVAEQAVQASVPAVYLSDNGPVYCLADQNKGNPLLLLCAQHEMDRERVNTDCCHVTENARLVNTESTSRIQQGRRRFKKYWGTCSTSPIHLPPSPSALTPVPPAPQYWETESAVGLKRALHSWWPVMEIGVVEEDLMDSDVMFYDSPRAWFVRVAWCDIHKGFCTQVWNQGEHVKCVRDTMSNTPGTYTLRYGVVVDIVRGRVGFVDVDKAVVLEEMDVEFRQTIYPVFGVLAYTDDFTVEMRLISGSDVTMTEDKQKLIYNCLR